VGAEYADVPDSALWHRARDHDGTAFGELFERHATAVYNHCFRRTASWSTAQDLTSIVFLETWRRRRDVRLHNDSILPWLLAVANNATRNVNRSIRRHQRLLVKLRGPSPQLEFGEDADQRVDDERTMAGLLVKINSLRIEEREVIALCDWANLSYAEAATALAVPIGTVRSRLSRAHEHLRRLLQDDSSPPQCGSLATSVDLPKETDGTS
jgi:RNA polymerase sigma-70 factor (ECF subfamily)